MWSWTEFCSPCVHICCCANFDTQYAALIRIVLLYQKLTPANGKQCKLTHFEEQESRLEVTTVCHNFNVPGLHRQEGATTGKALGNKTGRTPLNTL